MRVIDDAIVSRILDDTTEIVCPCQVIKALLFIFEGSRSNFSIEMIAYLGSKVLKIKKKWLSYRFDWERIIEIFTVEVFLGSLDEDTSNSKCVELRSSCSTNHL